MSDYPIISLERLNDIPDGVLRIDDPDAFLNTRANDSYEGGNSEIWHQLGGGDGGIAIQHLQLIYDTVLREGLFKGATVLDVGCGTGPMVTQLCENVGPEGKVHGIDIAEAQLAKARALAERTQKTNAEFRQGSASEGLPYDDDMFDCVVSHIAYQIMPKKKFVLEEVFRVLNPGGMISFVFNGECSFSKLVNAPESWCLIFDYVEKHPEAKGHVHYPLGVFPTAAQMRTWMEDIGYEDVEVIESKPFHLIPPVINPGYWSIWIDHEFLEPIARYARDKAAEIMKPVGVTEPRLHVFARKPE